MDFELIARNRVFSYGAAMAVGHTNTQLRAGLREHRLTSLHRGWYATGQATDATERHLLRLEAFVQQRAGRAIPSHWSHVLRAGLPTHRAHLDVVVLRRITPGGVQKVGRGFVVHPSFGDAHRGPAALALSIVLCGLRDPLAMLVPADRAVREGKVTCQDLTDAADLLGRRRGVAAVRAHLHRVDRRHESPGETRAHWVLGHLGYELDPQFAVPGTGGFTAGGLGYVADFRVRGTCVLVEFDGRVKYTPGPGETAEQARSRVLWQEKRREDRIRALGWEVVRLTWAELAGPQGVRVTLEAALARSRARSAPA